MNVEQEISDLKSALHRVEKRAEAAESYIAVSNLQRTYGYYVDKFQWEQVADLFSRDATLEINGRGKFRGHERIREYMRHFGPAQNGVLMNHIQLQPVIHVAEDAQTAKCRCRALMQVGRMGGEALWGEGIYENEYVKEDGVWKISRLRAYQTFYTPFDKGWAVEVTPIMGTFEDFPPDEPAEPYAVFPEIFVPPYHYANPVAEPCRTTAGDRSSPRARSLSPKLGHQNSCQARQQCRGRPKYDGLASSPLASRQWTKQWADWLEGGRHRRDQWQTRHCAENPMVLHRPDQACGGQRHKSGSAALHWLSP